MLLREARPADVPLLADAWYAMLEESGLLYRPVDPNWRPLLTAEFERGLSSGRQRWVVAEAEGRVVATGGLFLRRGGVGVALTGQSGTIAGIYTDPEYRRRGYALAIMHRLVEIARHEGCHTVRLRATASGRPLYERMGFLPGDDMYLPL